MKDVTEKEAVPHSYYYYFEEKTLLKTKISPANRSCSRWL